MQSLAIGYILQPFNRDLRLKTFIGITAQELSFTKKEQKQYKTHIYQQHSHNHSLAANTNGASW